MGEMRVITPSEVDVLLLADACAMRFKVKIPLPGLGPAITFTTKHKFHKLYRIVIGRHTKVIDLTSDEQQVTVFALHNVDLQHPEFWITWYNKTIKMGLWGKQHPFLVYPMHTDLEIGYVQFNTLSGNWAPVEWIVETSPVILKEMPSRTFESKLCWVSPQGDKLPANAMIGGFEFEPTYIARAHHNHSLCPGKYVPSKKLAYVPWGFREHAKRDYEILCGYNAIWVKTKLNYIPTNAVIGGRSEVHNEPLYIGRAMHDGKLLTGKVHIRYKTCYLPYNGQEIEVSSYEILVIPEDEIKQTIPFNLQAKVKII